MSNALPPHGCSCAPQALSGLTTAAQVLQAAARGALPPAYGHFCNTFGEWVEFRRPTEEERGAAPPHAGTSAAAAAGASAPSEQGGATEGVAGCSPVWPLPAGGWGGGGGVAAEARLGASSSSVGAEAEREAGSGGSGRAAAPLPQLDVHPLVWFR